MAYAYACIYNSDVSFWLLAVGYRLLAVSV